MLYPISFPLVILLFPLFRLFRSPLLFPFSFLCVQLHLYSSFFLQICNVSFIYPFLGQAASFVLLSPLIFYLSPLLSLDDRYFFSTFSHPLTPLYTMPVLNPAYFFPLSISPPPQNILPTQHYFIPTLSLSYFCHATLFVPLASSGRSALSFHEGGPT